MGRYGHALKKVHCVGKRWHGIVVLSHFKHRLIPSCRVPFDCLILQATTNELKSGLCQDILLIALTSRAILWRTLKGHLSLILQRMSGSKHTDIAALMKLLVRVVQGLKSKLSTTDLSSMKTFILQHGMMRNHMHSRDSPDNVYISRCYRWYETVNDRHKQVVVNSLRCWWKAKKM